MMSSKLVETFAGSLRTAHFLAIKRPPPTCSQPPLEFWPHVRYEEILGELDLERHRPAVASIRNKQVDSGVARWYPDVHMPKVLLDMGGCQVFTSVNCEKRPHRFQSRAV